MAEFLDPVLLQRDPIRMLALSYAAVADRNRILSLWNLDFALADAVSAARDTMIGRIRLAWWRDGLKDLDQGRVSAEPRLQAIADTVLDGRVAGELLSELAEGWAALLNEPLQAEDLEAHARMRGGTLFIAVARGAVEAPALIAAGGGWALMDLSRHLSDPLMADQAKAMALEKFEGVALHDLPRGLRGMAVLAKYQAKSSAPLANWRRFAIQVRGSLLGW